MKSMKCTLAVCMIGVFLVQVLTSGVWAQQGLKMSDFGKIVDQKMKGKPLMRCSSIKTAGSRVAPTSVKSSLPADTQKKVDALNRAIKKELSTFLPGMNHSVSRPGFPRKLKMEARAELMLGQPQKPKPIVKSVPWNRIVQAIQNLPEAKVNDPVIKATVDATVKMLSSKEFQKSYVQVCNKYKHRVQRQTRCCCLATAGSFIVGVFLWPTIHGAITGAAEGAGSSYGQGFGGYFTNTLAGALQGAAQGIQDQLR